MAKSEKKEAPHLTQFLAMLRAAGEEHKLAHNDKLTTVTVKNENGLGGMFYFKNGALSNVRFFVPSSGG